jgi:hypothetical protein
VLAGSRFATPTVPPVQLPQQTPPPAPAPAAPLAVHEPDVSSRESDAPRTTSEPDVVVELSTAELKRGEPRHDERSTRTAKRGRAAEETSFLDAVRLLRRARSALSKGEPGLALALLDELDARFPRTLLNEERGATRVLALCAHGRAAEAERLARSLFARHPRSIYAPRIAQSCAAKSVDDTSRGK